MKHHRSRVSSTYATKHFGKLADRVCEARAVFEVENHGRVVAEIRPAIHRVTLADFQEFLTRGPRPPAEALDAVDAASRDARADRAPAPRTLTGRAGRASTRG